MLEEEKRNVAAAERNRRILEGEDEQGDRSGEKIIDRFIAGGGSAVSGGNAGAGDGSGGTSASGGLRRRRGGNQGIASDNSDSDVKILSSRETADGNGDEKPQTALFKRFQGANKSSSSGQVNFSSADGVVSAEARNDGPGIDRGNDRNKPAGGSEMVGAGNQAAAGSAGNMEEGGSGEARFDSNIIRENSK
jgi:hypothetical protein